ncbi:MAG: hypothetical protein COA88_05695 [Kordia sp.]|nr:MAG: hypothetical protein COA88_05695 [Kordia sp.]
MNVLIWVNQFPTFSETFIRDQIINLKKNNLEIKIFCNYRNDSELGALCTYEKYALINDRVCLDEIIPKNKFIRILTVLSILCNSLFSANFLIYIKSLNFFKYGKESLNLVLFFIVKFLIKNKIEIIHAHFGPNGNKASVFKELGVPIKLYTTFHGYDIRLGIEKGGGVYNSLFKNADGIIAIAPYNKEKLMNFGAPKSVLIDLPNGVDVAFFNRRTPVSLEGKITILSVARLAPEKGVLLFLKALKLFKEKHVKIDLMYSVIGEGPLREQLERFIKTHKMGTYVKLLGSKNSEEVRHLMTNSDIFVLSSLTEVLPTVLLEAQASSMPILATHVGAVKQMLTDEAQVVRPNSVEALKNGLEELVAKRDSWRVIGEGNRKNVLNFYDIKKITQTLLCKYKNEG